MNNDLISHEALKENEPHYDEEGYRIFYESEIDNAPTVSPFKPMCKAKDEAICEEMTIDGHCNYIKPCPNKEERTQGEWIFNGFCHSSTQYRCNKCGFLTLVKISPCPNCGAKMKGGKE